MGGLSQSTTSRTAKLQPFGLLKLLTVVCDTALKLFGLWPLVVMLTTQSCILKVM